MKWPTRNELLLDSLNEYVDGHTTAKKALITMLQRSSMRYYQKYAKQMDEEFLVDPMKILLIGESGTGKTHLINSLALIAEFILIKVDATSFNVVAGSGGLKVPALKKMITTAAKEACANFPYKYFSLEGAVDRVVVFVDEIDKLGGTGTVGEWNKGVQSDFLTLFDDKDEFNAVSFVFAGAFSDITRRDLKKTSIGFTHNNVASSNEKHKCLEDQIASTGILPEIVGRFSSIVELDVFTTDDFYRIAKERILPKKQRDMAAFHVFGVELDDDKLMSIAKAATKSSQGVRYLKRAIDAEFLNLEFGAGIDNMLLPGGVL